MRPNGVLRSNVGNSQKRSLGTVAATDRVDLVAAAQAIKSANRAARVAAARAVQRAECWLGELVLLHRLNPADRALLDIDPEGPGCQQKAVSLKPANPPLQVVYTHRLFHRSWVLGRFSCVPWLVTMCVAVRLTSQPVSASISTKVERVDYYY